MTEEEILAKLQSIFDNLFVSPVKVTKELSADNVAEWDSLVQISLVVAVEKAFGIRFSVGEVESTKNIGDFVNIIQRRIASK